MTVRPATLSSPGGFLLAPTEERAASKLPRLTAMFWVMKIAATTLGETAGDLFSMTLGLGYAASSSALLFLFGLALAVQLRAARYHPLVYWTVILLTSTAGTTLSDYMDRTLGMGYAAGSAALVALLLGVFGIWRWSEGTLAVDAVRSRRAELFYWAAILCSNTLGTALGDFLADDSGLGFSGGALLIGTLLVAITLAAYLTSLSKTALFWLAFVLTRPFGATLGDVLTKSPEHGGIGLGTVASSAVLFAVLGACLLAAAVGARRSARARIAETT